MIELIDLLWVAGVIYLVTAVGHFVFFLVAVSTSPNRHGAFIGEAIRVIFLLASASLALVWPIIYIRRWLTIYIRG